MKLRNLALSLLFAATSAMALAQSAPTAASIMDAAYKQAAKENKKVFLMFHASWCGWCHKMDDSMNEPALKPFFTDNFVIAHLVVNESKGKENLENAGALQILEKYHADKDGIPMWYIFDKTGKLLADSKVRPEGALPGSEGGSNTGCPASQKEVDYFIGILKKTTPLKDTQLAMIATRFRQNEPQPTPKPAATPAP